MPGRIEHGILLALRGLRGGKATTTEIYEVLAEKLSLTSLGAIYVALDRMIKKRLVERERGKPLPERGGKARFYYKITNAGRAALIEAEEASAALGKLSVAMLSPRRR